MALCYKCEPAWPYVFHLWSSSSREENLFKLLEHDVIFCRIWSSYQLINKKSSNLNLSLVSEQHYYATRSASLQHLNPESFRINIRKFCPTILGCYYWNDIPLSIRNKPTRKLFKKALYQFYFAQYWYFQHYIFICYALTLSSLVYFLS